MDHLRISAALACGLLGFVPTTSYAQFYTDTGSPSNPAWSVVVQNLNNDSADPGPVPGSVINVNNAATEVGLYGNRPISVGSQRIHVCCNTSTGNPEDFTRWFQTDGNTQVFRLFVNDQNTATDRVGAARCEAFQTEKWKYSDGVTYEWTGRYTIARRQQGYSILQVMNDSNEWAMHLSMTGSGGLLVNNRRNASDFLITNPDGSTKDFDGKGFDVRVIDDGLNYKCWIDGVLVADNFYDRPTGETNFRWGKYMGSNILTSPSDVSVILVSGAQVRSWPGRLDTATSSIVKANNTTSLGNTASWTGGKVPGINNLAVWNSTVTTTNTTTLNTGLTWAGIRITNPGGNVTINGTVTLKLEGSGIDMSTATRSLTANCPVEPNVTAPWVIAASRVATFNGSIRGYQGITLSGGGRLILNAPNTYSGPTVINGGILQLGNGGTTGALDTDSTISVATGATFAVDQSDAVAQGAHFSGAAITGAGGLTKSGSGILTLTANNTYSGPTAINSGILQVGNGGTTGSLGNNSATSVAVGSTLRFNRSQPSDIYAYAGSLSGGGVVEIMAGTRMDFAANQTGSGGLAFDVDGALGIRAGSDGVTAVHLGALSGTGTIQRGGATGGSATVSIGGSNTNSVFSGTIITPELGLEKVGTGTLTLNGSNTYGGATTVRAGTLAFGNVSPFSSTSLISLSNGTLLRPTVGGATIHAPINIGGSGTTAFISAPTNLPGSADLSALTLAGVISGAGDITFTSSADQNALSTILLNGKSTYSGRTRLDTAGTDNTQIIVKLGTADALPTGTVLEINGQIGTGSGRFAELNLNGFSQRLAGLTNTLRSLRIQRIVNSNVSAAAVLTINIAANHTYSGTLGGSVGGSVAASAMPGSTDGNNFALTKGGAGILTLTGANTYSGNTTVSAGILQLGNGGTAGGLSPSSAITIASGATFVVNRSNSATQGTDFSSAAITGAGSLSKSGTGTLILRAANSFTGSTIVNAGILQLGDGGTAGGLSPGSAITIASGAIFSVNRSNSVTQGTDFSSAAITGAGGLSKSGAGVLALTASNAYGGPTTISFGTLQLGNGGTTGAISTASIINVANGATFAVNRSNSTTQGLGFSITPITGAGGLTQAGTGTLILRAANTYTGPTIVNAGILQLGDGGAAGGLSPSSAITIASGATFSVNRSNSATQGTDFSSAPITGAGGLTQVGTGTLILRAANTYTGPTAVNAGILQLGDGGAAGGLSPSSAITIADGATFAVNCGDNIAQGTHFSTAPIAGAGSLAKLGTGSLILNAANTYSGNTTVIAGILNLGALEVIPDGPGMGNVVLDGILDLNGYNEQINGLSGIGIVDNSAADTLSTLTVGANNQNSSFSGHLQNSGSSAILNLTKTGTGSQTLVGSNTFSGLTRIDAGALIIRNATALGDAAGSTEVNGNDSGSAGNARLALDGGITVTGEAVTIKGGGDLTGALTSISGSNEWAGNVTIGAPLTHIGASAGATLRVSGVIDSGTDPHGMIVRTADLTGVVTLAGANTYLGDTILYIGKLQLDGGDDRLPVASKLTLGSGNLFSEFDLNGRSQQLSGLAIASGATAANNSIHNSSATLSTLTINTAAASPSAFSGLLTGNLALTKTGSDTLTLAAANTHTGATSVIQGTLSLANTNSANETSTVTIAKSGATLDLTFIGTDTVNELSIGTILMPAGVYEAVGNPGAGIEIPQITGTGTLTVTSGSSPLDVGYEVWKITNGTDLLINGDHDADDVPNGIEHFLGGYGNTTGFTPLPDIVPDGQTFSITWTKGVGYAGNYGTHFSVETSESLDGIWTSEPGEPDPAATVTFPTADTVKYTFPSPMNGRKFVRLNVIGP